MTTIIITRAFLYTHFQLPSALLTRIKNKSFVRYECTRICMWGIMFFNGGRYTPHAFHKYAAYEVHKKPDAYLYGINDSECFHFSYQMLVFNIWKYICLWLFNLKKRNYIYVNMFFKVRPSRPVLGFCLISCPILTNPGYRQITLLFVYTYYRRHNLYDQHALLEEFRYTKIT